MSFGAVVGSRSNQGRKDFLTYWKNSITVPGPETEEISKAVKKAGAYVVIGVIEKDHETSSGTLYCTALFFGPNGELLGKNRQKIRLLFTYNMINQTSRVKEPLPSTLEHKRQSHTDQITAPLQREKVQKSSYAPLIQPQSQNFVSKNH